MKLTISDAVFQVFAKVEGNPELAQAKVLASAVDYAVLESTGEDAFTVRVKHDLGKVLASGQVITFNCSGETTGEVNVVRDLTSDENKPPIAAAQGKAPKKTGGQSPVRAAPAAGRDGYSRRLD